MSKCPCAPARLHACLPACIHTQNTTTATQPRQNLEKTPLVDVSLEPTELLDKTRWVHARTHLHPHLRMCMHTALMVPGKAHVHHHRSCRRQHAARRVWHTTRALSLQLQEQQSVALQAALTPEAQSATTHTRAQPHRYYKSSRVLPEDEEALLTSVVQRLEDIVNKRGGCGRVRGRGSQRCSAGSTEHLGPT